ncbi:recombinase family protein [Actinomadura sp. WMMA1423]|uniref:recombinase family protein n=1 Tax=Actinomadura sp. WMMA1423 TaxID=2591108 RepID=UPI0011467106|nr:recombinase family protein [Actinomadura sp. WMMA1423]
MTATDSDLIPVVDYARASVDKAKDAHTVADQQAINEKTAALLGCRIVARFSDNDKSASKEGVRRHDFEAMLRVLRKGKLADGTPVMGCVVVADDRLVRRAGDYERFVDAITYDDGRVFADKRGFKDL